jgi:hypothetical protein
MSTGEPEPDEDDFGDEDDPLGQPLLGPTPDDDADGEGSDDE